MWHASEGKHQSALWCIVVVIVNLGIVMVTVLWTRIFHGPDQWWIVPYHSSFAERWWQSQRLHRGVPVQLNVLTFCKTKKNVRKTIKIHRGLNQWAVTCLRAPATMITSSQPQTDWSRSTWPRSQTIMGDWHHIKIPDLFSSTGACSPPVCFFPRPDCQSAASVPQPRNLWPWPWEWACVSWFGKTRYREPTPGFQVYKYGKWRPQGEGCHLVPIFRSSQGNFMMTTVRWNHHFAIIDNNDHILSCEDILIASDGAETCGDWKKPTSLISFRTSSFFAAGMKCTMHALQSALYTSCGWETLVFAILINCLSESLVPNWMVGSSHSSFIFLVIFSNLARTSVEAPGTMDLSKEARVKVVVSSRVWKWNKCITSFVNQGLVGSGGVAVAMILKEGCTANSYDEFKAKPGTLMWWWMINWMMGDE